MKNNNPSPFSRLIDPLSVNDFWSDLFEKKFHFFSSELVKINFDFLKFENLLWAFEEVLDKKVQLNYKGNDIELHRKTSSKDWFRWCLDMYHEGATIIFNGIDEIDPEVARFARSIDPVFKGRTTVNAFLTPAGSHGFLPHFDTHDVFILQTDGEKHWDLYKNGLELPVDRQIYLVDQDDLGEKKANYKLKKNNVLYIPRGVIHSSNTTDSYSLHLTVGVRPLLASDYYKTLVEVITEKDPDFRKSIVNPVSEFSVEERKKLNKQLVDLSDDFEVADEVYQRIGIKLASSVRPLPGFHIKGLHGTKQTDTDTLVEKAVETFVLEEGEERIKLYFPGIGLTANEDIKPGYFSLPAVAKAAIEMILQSKGPFTANDLPSSYDEQSRLVIIRRLVIEGFLKVV